MRIFAALLAALAVAASATAAGGPRVRLVDESPATVAGVGFRAAERVQVSVVAGDVSLRKTVAATGEGRFTARWQRSLPDGCHAIFVSAIGSRGSRAVLKVAPTECPPPAPADR